MVRKLPVDTPVHEFVARHESNHGISEENPTSQQERDATKIAGPDGHLLAENKRQRGGLGRLKSTNASKLAANAQSGSHY